MEWGAGVPSWKWEVGWSAFQIRREEVEEVQMWGIDGGGNDLPKGEEYG